MSIRRTKAAKVQGITGVGAFAGGGKGRGYGRRRGKGGGRGPFAGGEKGRSHGRWREKRARPPAGGRDAAANGGELVGRLVTIGWWRRGVGSFLGSVYF
jgi:hypothetical protein